jgi:hypothetical protein
MTITPYCPTTKSIQLKQGHYKCENIAGDEEMHSYKGSRLCDNYVLLVLNLTFQLSHDLQGMTVQLATKMQCLEYYANEN